MKNVDNIIKQIELAIEKYELIIHRNESIISRKKCKTEKELEYYKRKIEELKYRIKELKKTNSSGLIPTYGDGKYATSSYKEAIDMLRVCYYNYFQQDPRILPVPKWDMMFYDPTLYIPVDTYLVNGKIPFYIMYSANYPEYKSDNTKSISIELPFEVLSKEENEEYLKLIIQLIKIYSGDNVNLVFGNGISTRGTLSYIGDKNKGSCINNEDWYYNFFYELCDNNVRNIIYIGESIRKGVKSETIDKVQREIIDIHKRLTASKLMTQEELEESNERIKKRILSISNH